MDAMYPVLVIGAGKIGSLIACLFADTNDYLVHLADVNFSGRDVKCLLKAVPEITKVSLDVKDQQSIQTYIKKNRILAVISSLPYFLNTYVAQAAKAEKTHYFDLTEDTSITDVVKAIAADAKHAFVPQCGLAPGFVNIVAYHLIQEFDIVHQVKLRVGALPQSASNALHYSLTWSTDGVINEYGNPCYGLEKGMKVTLSPLEGLESLEIDGCTYEAFNTSGGLGSLAESQLGKVQNLNYKTIRYPGHCEKMRLLMIDLKLNEDRPTLKTILERAIPKTYQDMVLIYVSVEGIKDGELLEKNYVKKIYPKTIRGIDWSAIQISTASALCAIVDLVLSNEKKYHALVLQEQFCLADVLANRFGQHYA